MNAKIQYYKGYLKQKNITYEKLSEMSGIPLNTLKNIFRGKTEHPRIDTIQAIERALGIDSPQWTEEERALGLSDNHLIALSDEDRELINLFAEAEETLGKAYVRGVKQMVRIAIDTNGKP